MELRRSTRLSSTPSNQLSTTRSPPLKRRKVDITVVRGRSVQASSTSLGLAVRRSDANEDLVVAELEVEEVETKSTTRRRKRQTAVEPAPEDFPQRADNSQHGLFIGAHVSAAGGPHNAIINAAKLGANAFALFLKSQRKWSSPALSEDSITLFKQRMKSFNYSADQVLPHGSYLINLANPDAEKREKSYECFLDDLKRCEQLGLTLYNFHPGSTVGAAEPAICISHIADCLNRAHGETSSVVTVIENMAGAGNVLGVRFSDIADIIRQVHDKTRVGVCLDTCHLFAAGYDIRTKEGIELTLTDFDDKIGLGYLRGMHLNDSKAALGSHKDRHENIGLGEIGLPSFHALLRALSSRTRMQKLKKIIPLVLETPLGSSEDTNIWQTEISVLNRLAGIEEEKGTDDARKGEDSSDAVVGDLVKEVRCVVGRKT